MPGPLGHESVRQFCSKVRIFLADIVDISYLSVTRDYIFCIEGASGLCAFVH